MLKVGGIVVDRPAGWPTLVTSPGCQAGLFSPPSFSSFLGTFAHCTLWARQNTLSGGHAYCFEAYLPWGVATVAGLMVFNEWLCGGVRGGIQPFVICWFVTHLPHLLPDRLAFFPHPLHPGLHKRNMCKAVQLNPSSPLYYPLKIKDVLRNLSFLKISGCLLKKKKNLLGEPLISAEQLNTMRNTPARQTRYCLSFCNLQIVWFCKLGNICNRANGAHFQSIVWLAFSL